MRFVPAPVVAFVVPLIVYLATLVNVWAAPRLRFPSNLINYAWLTLAAMSLGIAVWGWVRMKRLRLLGGLVLFPLLCVASGTVVVAGLGLVGTVVRGHGYCEPVECESVGVEDVHVVYCDFEGALSSGPIEVRIIHERRIMPGVLSTRIVATVPWWEDMQLVVTGSELEVSGRDDRGIERTRAYQLRTGRLEMSRAGRTTRR